MRTLLTWTMAIASVGAATPGASSKGPRLPEDFKWGRCLLQVDGRKYIAGRCAYHLDEDGSFEIADPGQFWRHDGHFAFVFPAGRSADGSWNEESIASHAQDRLGTLIKKGACWTNKRARICLWQK